jgi:hypothetical protein
MTNEQYERIWNIVNKCKFRLCSTVHITINLRRHASKVVGGWSRAYIQVEMMGHGTGSKHDVSEHMTESEIVYRCFKAVSTYMEFEVRRAFAYDGVELFHPHTSVQALMEASKTREVRNEPIGN